MAQPQPSDVGFGYVNRHESVEMPDTDDNDYPSVPKTPLKSALKTPGAAPRDFHDFRSPTFREEEVLEKNEAATDIKQAADLVSFRRACRMLSLFTNARRRKSRQECAWRR